ncbi:MAG TPA: GvpL/GvpF family gas vesicle protein, partial [Pseudonocardia sp.]|nr:GvpL/GvpF family gas vesicle protein [Pseudonocardia sp.]
VASRRYQPQDPRLSGRREEMVLNVAYLVDEAGADALRRLVEQHDGQSLRLELTGPWAPYSFATLEEEP